MCSLPTLLTVIAVLPLDRALCPQRELCEHLKLVPVLKPRFCLRISSGNRPHAPLAPSVSQDPRSLSGTPGAFLSENSRLPWACLRCPSAPVLCNLYHAQFLGEHITFLTATQFSCEPFHSKWERVFPTDWNSQLCPDLIDHISHSVRIRTGLSSSPGA